MAVSVKALSRVGNLSQRLWVQFSPGGMAFLSKKGKASLLCWLKKGGNL